MVRRRVVQLMDLAEFLDQEVKQTSYRDVEAKTGVSRGALENIIKRTNTEPPGLETLTRISVAYNRPLWEVVQMVVDLELPQTPTELGERMAAIVERHPTLARHIARLQRLADTNPDFVQGVILAIEAVDRGGSAPPSK